MRSSGKSSSGSKIPAPFKSMHLKDRLTKWLTTDWFNAAIMLAVFFLTKSYRYGWDDQHLEIPLLKNLIDPGLYPGDYYVLSIKENFATYFYVILARFISIDQIPAVYFALYLISRYLLFYWLYKLWYFISKEKATAFIIVLVFLFLGRVQEFFYKTFSHQEFALAFIMAGLYFFYKERFFLASLIFGLMANIHILYSAFPFTYMAAYLLLFHKKSKWWNLFISLGIFLVSAIPILIWVAKKAEGGFFSNPIPAASKEVHWAVLYELACPQNFIFLGRPFHFMLYDFKDWFGAAQKYILLILFYVFNVLYNEDFRKDKKAQSISLMVLFFLAVTYIFTYVKPTRSVLDLNLVRNIQYLFLILMGYTAIYASKVFQKGGILICYFTAIVLGFFMFNDLVASACTAFLIVLTAWNIFYKKPAGLVRNFVLGTFFVCLLIIFGYLLKLLSLTYPAMPELISSAALI